MRMRFLAAISLAMAPLVAAAQNDTGELWEISSQMNIPGMPAGMGAQTQRICQGDDPAHRAASDKDQKDCKITDKKMTATRTTVTMTCKQGTMSVDQQYNAARTEFKGTIKMTGKEGDFTMNTTGRKVGACSLQEAKRASDAKDAAIKKQVDAGIAAGAAAQKQTDDILIKGCNAGLESMAYYQLASYGPCDKKADKKAAKQCEEIAKERPAVAKTCNARFAEFCKRYQMPEGFIKAKADENAAQMCGVTTASVKAAQCPKAASSGSLDFLGAYCPVEAKPLAQEHCTQRDYTSRMGGKYARFCDSYFAANSLEKPGAQPQSATEKATDQVKQGVSKGIDKLRGLFGR